MSVNSDADIAIHRKVLTIFAIICRYHRDIIWVSGMRNASSIFDGSAALTPPPPPPPPHTHTQSRNSSNLFFTDVMNDDPGVCIERCRHRDSEEQTRRCTDTQTGQHTERLKRQKLCSAFDYMFRL